MRHYKNAADTLYRDLGVRPSRELRDMYTLILKEEPVWEVDIDAVMASMRNLAGRRTAVFCNFEQFKMIYQLEVRRAPRIGGCLHIAMITVLDADGAVLSAKVSDVILEQVQQTIVQVLRQSDVVARYGRCQFIIMLPYANLEDSSMVMERIVDAYYSRHPKSAVQLTYQIRELELS